MKKLLALVLALVMTLGLATVSTSAAYSDADDIEYTEAVDVMTAVGVFQGKGDAFAPNDNLNRAEAAKLIAYLMLGNKTAESMVGSGTRFTDVPADHWAAGFIEYLASVGIVSGVGNNQFNPNGQVTGVQFAKMLLVALGYDAEIEKFVGDGWSINIQKVANQNDLFKGLDISANDALTRQQAAQMCLNDLKADMVEYADKGTTVNVGGATVTTGVKNAEEKVEKGSNNYNGAAVGTSDRNYRQLAEELYGNDLKLDDAGADEFGRPTNKWTYKNVEVGEYSNKSNLLETYTAKFSKKSLYDLLGKDQYDNIKDGKTTLNLWLDGVKTTYKTSADISTVMDRSDTGALNNSGNGTLTQVYLDDDNDIVDVVSVQTYVWQVTADYSESRGDVSVKAVGKTIMGTTPATPVISLKDSVLKDDDFEAVKDLKKDDYVLITASHSTTGAAYEVESVAKAELRTGKVDTYTEGDTVTIAGEKLKYSKMVPTDADEHKNAKYTIGETASLVMDAYGYVIAVDEAVVNNNYVFISNIAATSGLNTQSEADAYFTDGTNESLKINKLGGKDTKSAILGTNTGTGILANIGSFASAGTNVNPSNNAGWYTYSKTSGDKYNLSAIGSSYAQVGYTYDASTASIADVMSNNKVNFLKTGGNQLKSAILSGLTDTTVASNTLKANNDTIFVVEQDGDVNVYTGVKNAPGVSLTKRAGANSDKAVVVAAYDTDNMYAKYVFVTLTKDADLDGGNNTELFYVLKNDTKNWIDEQNSYAMWYVINSAGKAELVKTDYDFTAGNYRGYYKVFKNSDGDYSKVTPVSGTNAVTNENTYVNGSHYFEMRNVRVSSTTDADRITYSKGSLSVHGYGFTVADDTKIVLVQSKSLDATLMNNPDLNYEIEVLTGDELEQKFVDCDTYIYDVQARIGGTVKNTDNDAATYTGDTDLKEIYITVKAAHKVGTTAAATSTLSKEIEYVGINKAGANYTVYYYVEAGGAVTTSLEDQQALLTTKAGYDAAKFVGGTAWDLTTGGNTYSNINVTFTQVYKLSLGGDTFYLANTDGLATGTDKLGKAMTIPAKYVVWNTNDATPTVDDETGVTTMGTRDLTMVNNSGTAAPDALNAALKKGNVTLSKDASFTGDVTVPADTTLKLTGAADLTVTGNINLESGAKIDNQGTGTVTATKILKLEDGSTVTGGTVAAGTTVVGCTIKVKTLKTDKLFLVGDEESVVTVETKIQNVADTGLPAIYLGYDYDAANNKAAEGGSDATSLTIPATDFSGKTIYAAGNATIAGIKDDGNTGVVTIQAAAGAEVKVDASGDSSTALTLAVKAEGDCNVTTTKGTTAVTTNVATKDANGSDITVNAADVKVAAESSATTTAKSDNEKVSVDVDTGIKAPEIVANKSAVKSGVAADDESWECEGSVSDNTVTVTKMIKGTGEGKYTGTILKTSIANWSFSDAQIQEGLIVLKLYVPDGMNTWVQYSGANLEKEINSGTSSNLDENSVAGGHYMYMVLGIGNIPSAIKMEYKNSSGNIIGTQTINLVKG